MAIISISGKIGSGKDTVASIIQELDPAGDWAVKKFAGKVKQVAKLLTGVPLWKFEDQEFKQQYMGPEWDMTYREFLQKIGTDAMREGLHKNTWVNSLFAEYTIDNPNWIITDTRFPNELDAVKEYGGLTIKIVRNTNNTIGNQHASETALDHITNWDYVIDNNESVNSLKESIKQILSKECYI